MNFETADRILRLEDVRKRTGLSRSSIYLYVKKGFLPKPVNLGARAIGWRESEINQWLKERI